WLAGTDPTPMLEFLRGKSVAKDLRVASRRVIRVPDYPESRVSGRKIRLFACACCRRIWHLLRDQRSRTAVEVVEQFADSQATEEELREAGRSAEAAASATYDAAHDPIEAEAEASGLRPDEWVHAAWEDASDAAAAEEAAFNTTALREADLAGWEDAARAVRLAQNDRAAEKAEQQIQADLLRCIVGNPFRRVLVDPSWLTWKDGTIPKLAQAAYEQRALPSGHLDNARLAVLADALEEAGCSDPHILGHLRGPGPHVRGCAVLDALRGRE